MPIIPKKRVIGDIVKFLSEYLVLPKDSVTVIACWVAAAWLSEVWDKFPHLVITSPEKRCGKSTLLELLYLIVPRPRLTTNISPAALYRVVHKEKPTLLMDESQSISRRNSEASEVIREILNAGISRNAKVTRCGGERWDTVEEFSVYSPKVFAMIGQPDGVLADRCLVVPMKRKVGIDIVKRYRSRIVEPLGAVLHDKLEVWAKRNMKSASLIYDDLDPFRISNDRIADLLLPLQTVAELEITGIDGIDGLPEGYRGVRESLRKYVEGLETLEKSEEDLSLGLRLLAAILEVVGLDESFIYTYILINKLVYKNPSTWAYCNNGRPITAEMISFLLRPYGLVPRRDLKQKGRGYSIPDLRAAYSLYTSSPTSP